MTEQQRDDFKRWADAALYIADANGISDDTEIPTWPRGRPGDELMERYPQLNIGAVREAMAALSHAEGEAVDHWAVRNPGLADQFRAEAQAVRKRLGFESDADDVSPNDLRERIAEIEGAPQVAVPEGWKLVPEKPTETMKQAGSQINYEGVSWRAAENSAYEIYCAMLAAAPTAPAGEPCPRCRGTGKHFVGPIDCPGISVCKLCKAPIEQPVSDPDGLPESPRPMSTAPRDSTMVRLLVQFTEHGVNDGFDSGPAWTIGANTYDDSGDDEWYIAGWDWQQDCFTAGEGEPLGWLPMLSAPAPDEREIAAAWINGCDESAPAALRFLARNPRPAAGEQRYNAEHLLQLAQELEGSIARLRAGKEGQ